MATPEDALKAVEILSDIVLGLIEHPTFEYRYDLEALKRGCADLRKGCRDSKDALKVLVKPLPESPGASSRCLGS